MGLGLGAWQEGWAAGDAAIRLSTTKWLHSAPLGLPEERRSGGPGHAPPSVPPPPAGVHNSDRSSQPWHRRTISCLMEITHLRPGGHVITDYAMLR